jgi:hypothetical protein
MSAAEQKILVHSTGYLSPASPLQILPPPADNP